MEGRWALRAALCRSQPGHARALLGRSVGGHLHRCGRLALSVGFSLWRLRLQRVRPHTRRRLWMRCSRQLRGRLPSAAARAPHAAADIIGHTTTGANSEQAVREEIERLRRENAAIKKGLAVRPLSSALSWMNIHAQGRDGGASMQARLSGGMGGAATCRAAIFSSRGASGCRVCQARQPLR